MRCPVCTREMLALFTSYVCDHCDGVTELSYHHGFIVFSGDHLFDGRPVYVFRTRADAEVWRKANSLQHCPIQRVLSENEFVWRPSKGSVKGIELAERPYRLFRDHRFAPGPHRAFVAAHDTSKAA